MADSGDAPGRSGHRIVPHAADVILEAWSMTRTGCLEEAALALVESFVDLTDAVATDEVEVTIDDRSGDDVEVMVALLEEVVFLLDAHGVVPVGLRLAERRDGYLTGTAATVPVDRVEVTGAVPKGVSRSDLVFEPRDGGWWCRVLVDV